VTPPHPVDCSRELAVSERRLSPPQTSVHTEQQTGTTVQTG